MKIETSSIRETFCNPEVTLLDNLTLFHAEPFFHEVPTASSRYTLDFIKSIARHPQDSAFLGMVEALVLFDTCAIDHFTLIASESCMRMYALFPEVFRAVFLAKKTRDLLYDHLLEKGLPTDATKALESERRFIGDKYYGNKSRTGVAGGFADQYYDPSDSFKHQAIVEGTYKPLNQVRSLFYVSLAKRMGIPYNPHPWREKEIRVALGNYGSVSRAVLDYFVKEMSAALKESIPESIRAIGKLAAPPLAASVLRRADRPKYIAEAITDMRESKNAKNFRRWCQDLRSALDDGPQGGHDVQKMWGTLSQLTNKWKVDLDEEVRYRTRSLRLALGPSGAKGGLEFEFKDPLVWIKRRYRPLLFLNDLYRPTMSKDGK